MTDGFGDLDSLADSVTERDELVARVREHAGTIARELALLSGGDYGQQSFKTERGTWTLKYDGGDIAYLRYEPRSGSDIYVISTKQHPEPAQLATAMADYGAFVNAYNDYVDSLTDVLTDVTVETPPVASTESIVAERDALLSTIRSVADRIAGELNRYDGEYGTYATTVSGTRWELKWDGPKAAYLRIGGEDGVYLLSQYEPPSAPDVKRYGPDVGAFVDAFNEYVTELEADLSTVSIHDGDQ